VTCDLVLFFLAELQIEITCALSQAAAAHHGLVTATCYARRCRCFCPRGAVKKKKKKAT
jgi:hypothetical protein